MTRLAALLFWFDESLQRSLQSAGFEPVTRSQSLFLLCVAAGERRPSRLASLLGISRQAVSHIVADLSKRGLITLTVDPADARGRIVEYSFDAQDFRRAAHAVVSELEAVLERRIGPDTVARLRADLAGDWGEFPKLDVAREEGGGWRVREEETPG